MARLGSKPVADDFTNDGLADALEYLHKKGGMRVVGQRRLRSLKSIPLMLIGVY